MNCDEVILQHINSLDILLEKVYRLLWQNNIRVHRHHLECRQIAELLYSVTVIYLS